MAEIEPGFSIERGPTLEKVRFKHPLLTEPERNSIRGKSAGAYRGYHTFQWTPAVQALCLLFLRTRLCRTGRGSASPGEVLSGGAGSPASSLDYAVSKQPLWLLDMFGIDKQGNPLVRRILDRTNPERKRGGKVCIGVNPSHIASRDIHIRVAEREIADPAALAALADEIEANWRSAAGGAGRTSPELAERVERQSASAPVAVLPICASPRIDPSLAGGFTDEILIALIASGSAAPLLIEGLAGESADLAAHLPQAAQRGCELAIAGRIRVLDDKLQVCFHLINAQSGIVCWSRSYRGDMAGQYLLQQRAAHELSDALTRFLAEPLPCAV